MSFGSRLFTKPPCKTIRSRETTSLIGTSFIPGVEAAVCERSSEVVCRFVHLQRDHMKHLLLRVCVCVSVCLLLFGEGTFFTFGTAALDGEDNLLSPLFAPLGPDK